MADITELFGKWRGEKEQQNQITANAINMGEAVNIPTSDNSSFIGNAINDVANKFGQWWQGAKAGAAELGRAAQQMPVSMSSAEMPGGAGLTPEDQAAIEYNQQAVSNFTNETVKPVAYAAGLAVPAVAAPFIANDAVNLAKESGPIEAGKELLGINAVARAIENPQEFGQRFYNEPVTTATELLPAALIGRGVYQGVRGRRGGTAAEEVRPEMKPAETTSPAGDVGQQFAEWRQAKTGESNVAALEQRLSARINEAIPETYPAIGLSIRKVNDTPAAAVTPEVQFSDPIIEARWQTAKKGIPSEGLIDRVKAGLETFKNRISREYENLPHTQEFSQLRFDLLNFEKQKGVASDRTARILQGITTKLDKGAYDLFSRKVVLDDLAVTGEKLPFGLTKETLPTEKAAIDSAATQNPAITEAVGLRRQAWQAVKSDYIKAMKDIGFDVSDKLTRQDYFRHQVLEYANAKALLGPRGRLGTPTNRGFLKEREGSTKDINANYLQAEFEVMGQMLYDTEIARTIQKAQKNYDIRPQLQKQFKGDWRNNLPEGYTTWQPREGSSFYLAHSIPEQLATKLFGGVLGEIGIKPEQVQTVLAKGSRFREMVVKQEVADTLNKISEPPSTSSIGQVSRAVVTPWKQWTLMSPTRFIKYELRNISGDADAVFAMNPRAFTKVPQAVRELYQAVINDRPMTPTLKEWFNRGGMESSLFVHELPELNRLKMFDRLSDANPNIIKKAWEGYWTKVRKYNAFREGVLRYANFLEYAEQMERNGGKPRNFGGSNPSEVIGLRNNYDKAYKLSNEVLGAYDSVSALGKEVRSTLIPFWSWYETNFRRYSQFFKNQAVDGTLAEAVGRKFIGTAAKASVQAPVMVGSFVVKAGALWAAIQAYNELRFPDEEKELPPEERGRFHIILGRDDQGKVKYFSRLGAFSDFLEWFGLDTPIRDVKDLLNGTRAPREIFADMGKSPANKIAQGISPTIKLPAELATGKKTFPDVFSPRSITDRTAYTAESFGLGNEFKALSRTPLARSAGINPRPGRSYLTQETGEGLLYYKSDPGAAAYNGIQELKRQYLEKQGRASEGNISSPRTETLKNYKLALRYDDKETARFYLEQYKKIGGTQKDLLTSISSLNPLHGLPKKDMGAFLKSLNPEQRKQLQEAVKFYKETLSK